MTEINSQKSCSTSCATMATASLQKRLIAGAIGGLAGGAVYSVLMQKMGMFGMMAHMMGMSSPIVGMMMHAMISVLFGLGLGLLLRWIPSCPGKSLLFAILYGVFLWIIGPMMAMPMMTGSAMFQFSTKMAQTSLYWHIIFAVVALIVARIFLRVCQK